MLADLVRFQREARKLLASRRATGPSLGHFLEERRYSRAFIDRLIVPQAAAVWSADPRQMWSFPARFLVEFFDNHGMLGLRDRPKWRTVAGRLAPLRRGADRAVAGPAAAGRRSVDRRADPTTSRSRRAADPERFDHVVLATHSDQALSCSPTPRSASTSCSARSPTSPTRRCSTPTRPAAAPPPRVGELELPPARRADRQADRDLPHEPPAVAASRQRVLRHAQPHRGDRPRQGHPHDPLRAPGLHRGGAGRTGAPPRDQRPEPHALLRRLLGLGLPRGRRDERRAGRRPGSERGRCDRQPAIYEGHIRHRRFAVRNHEFRTGSRWPTSTSTSCRLLGGRLDHARARGSCASAAATTWATRRRRSTTRSARAGRSAPAGRPGPIRLSPTCAPSATASTRSPSTTASTRRRARSRRSSPRSPTRPGASATPTCCREATGRGATSTRPCTSRRS